MANLLEEVGSSFLAGMTDSAPAESYRPDEAATLLNYRVTPDGEAEVRSGSQRTHTAALNSGAHGYGGFLFTTSVGQVQWIVFAGDTGYYSTDEGVGWTEIATGLREDYWDAASMQIGGTNYIYFANGSTTLYRWDGSNWTTETGPVANCTRVESHLERLWTTNGKNIYASKIGDPTVWAIPDGIVVPFNTHDGDAEIIALYSIGYQLLVFKRGSFGYVEGSGNSDVVSAAGTRGISRDVGCIAFRSLVGVGGNGVMFLSRRGFEFYAPGLNPIMVSRAVETFMQAINWSDIEADEGIPTAYFYPRKLTYECWLTGVTGQNDQAFVYRLPSAERPGAASIFDSATEDGENVQVVDGFLEIGGTGRLRTQGGFLQIVTTASAPGAYADVSSGFLDLATNDTVPAATFSADRGDDAQAPVSIGYDGFVRELDTGDGDDLLSDASGGVAINDKLVARPMLFGEPNRKKRGRTIRVKATTTAERTPSVLLIADGNEGTAHSVTFASGGPTVERVRVNGRGAELQVQITSAGAGTKISGVAIGAELLRERP